MFKILGIGTAPLFVEPALNAALGTSPWSIIDAASRLSAAAAENQSKL